MANQFYTYLLNSSNSSVTVELLDQKYVVVPAKVSCIRIFILLAGLVSSQVKDCYLVNILQTLHDEEEKTLILFTNSCR